MKKYFIFRHKVSPLVVTIFASTLLLGTILFLHIRNAGMTQQTVTYDMKHIEQTTSLINGTWQYMPGVTRTPEGLLVKPLPFSIVEQDGSLSQLNPRVNLAGTYVQAVSGDFEINSTIQLQNSNSATIQFYGRVPLIADEFRIERESVQATIEKNKVTVKVWDGVRQRAREVRSFAFTPGSTLQFTFARKGTTLLFLVNNKQIGTVRDSRIFKSGQIWIGLENQDKEWLLTDLSVKSTIGGTITSLDTSTANITEPDQTGIQALAAKKRPEFIIGAAQSLNTLTSDPQYAQIALDKNKFGGLTPENGMKMINLQPQQGVYSFEYADALVKLAKQNGLTVHGHALVFGEANPTWFNALPVRTTADKQTIERIMKDHITTVVKHFGNDVKSWDVINEPMSDYDENEVMRTHKWYLAMGDEYIVKALTAARAANPDALLFINEYGLEEDGDRWDEFLSLLQKTKTKLAANGVTTDKLGVGFQSHVYESGDKINPETLRQHIRTLEKLGFKTQISEMDVYTDDGDKLQTDQYKKVFEACFAEKNCIAWRAWILSDRYDFWKDDNGQIETGEDGLYDTNMQPRPGYTAIQQLLSK